MENEKSAKDLLYEQIQSMATKLKTTEGSERSVLLGDLTELVRVYSEMEKLDIERTEKDRRFKEDIRQKDLDRDYRDILERDRMAMEKEKDQLDRELRERLEKEKVSQESRTGWRDFGVRAAGVVGQLGISALFLALGMKLEFLDNGSICSFTVKELMKRAMTPKIA